MEIFVLKENVVSEISKALLNDIFAQLLLVTLTDQISVVRRKFDEIIPTN